MTNKFAYLTKTARPRALLETQRKMNHITMPLSPYGEYCNVLFDAGSCTQDVIDGDFNLAPPVKSRRKGAAA